MLRSVAVIPALLLAALAAAAEPLLAPSPAAFAFQGRSELGRGELVPAAGLPASATATQAWRVTVLSKPEKDWMVNLLGPVGRPIAQNDLLVVSFWARADRRPEGQAVLSVVHQRATAPFAGPFSQVVEPGTEWKQFRFAYRAKGPYAAGETRIAFFCAGAAPQVVEIAAVQCEDHGGADPAALGLPLWKPPVR